MMTKYLILLFILLFSSFGFAGLKKSNSVTLLKKPFYLGEKESKLLKRELIKARMTDQTFSLNFICDKYKRTPRSKSRSINCQAVSVSKEITSEPSRKKVKR